MILTVVALLGVRGFVEPGTGEDEGLLLVYPLQVLDGQLPYRDFMSAYGPGETYLLAGLYWLFSPSIIVERMVGLLTHLAIVGGVYALYRPRGRRIAGALGLLSGVLMLPLTNTAFAFLACVAFSLWGLVYALHRRGAHNLAVAGLLAGLAVTWRPDTAPLALLPLMPALWSRRTELPWAAGGFVVGLLPTLVLLAITPKAFVTSFLDRAARGAAESRLPIPPVFASDRNLFYVMLVATALVVVAAFLRDESHMQNVCVALFSLLLMPQALQRCDWIHLLFAGCVTIPAFVELIHRRLERISSLGLSTGALAALAGISPLVAAPAQYGPALARAAVGPAFPPPTVQNQGRTLPVHGDQEAATIRAVLAAIERVSSPGDTVFVTYADLVRPLFSDISLYFLLPELRVTAYNLEITPGVTNQPRARLDRDVANADVLVLHDFGTDRWKRDFPYSHPGWTKPAEVLRDQFCLVGEFGAYRVYTHCAADAA